MQKCFVPACRGGGGVKECCVCLSVCLSVPCSCSKRYILGLWLPTIETPCWKSNRLGNTAVRPPEVSETGKGAYRFTAIGAITCCRAPGAECNLFVKQFVSRCLLVYWWTWTVLAVGSAGSSTSAAFATVSTSVFTISNSFVGLILPPLGEAKYCDDRVCLSIREHISGTIRHIFTKFYACYLRPWLGPSVAALRYVMYFRFYVWCHICPNWPYAGVSVTLKQPASQPDGAFISLGQPSFATKHQNPNCTVCIYRLLYNRLLWLLTI